jgi:Tol biopolymer transport system component
VATLAAVGLAMVAFRHGQQEAPRVVKLTALPPEKGQIVTGLNLSFPAPGAAVFAGPPAVSPDGRHIAFIANVDGKTGLWIRDLDSPTPHLLAGTEGAIGPFWSPDSRYVGFGADGKLRKIDVTGRPAVDNLRRAGSPRRHLEQDDVIVFQPHQFG